MPAVFRVKNSVKVFTDIAKKGSVHVRISKPLINLKKCSPDKMLRS